MEKTKRIVCSPRARQRLQAAREWLEAQSGDAEVLVLAANFEAADDVVREVAQGRGAAFGIHRLTMERLIGLLAAQEMAVRGLTPLSPLAFEAIAARAIYSLRGSGVIDYFEPVADRPGFPGAVAATVTELRLAGIGADQIAQLPEAGSALAAVMQRIDYELHDAGLIERAGILRLAIDAVAARPRFVGLPTLMLDLELESMAEREFVAALSAMAPAVMATTARGDQRSQSHLTAAIGATVEDLASEEAALTSLSRLQDHLFESAVPSRSALDGTVSIASAPGESRECVEIAREIAAAARRGVLFDRIAVLLHSPGNYMSHLEEAFRRAEIPAYFAAGTRRPEVGGRALLALLACAAEGLSARRFGEYLSLAQVPDSPAPDSVSDPVVAADPTLAPVALRQDFETIPQASPQPPVYISDPLPVVAGSVRAPWRWEELIVEAAVIGSRERWRRRLDGLREELESAASELAEDDPRAAARHRRLLDLAHLREVALPLIDILAELPGQATWEQWLIHLRRLTEAAVRDSAVVLEALAELTPMGPVGPVDLEEVRIVLSGRLGALTERPARRRYGKVFVGTAAGARGLAFDMVMVPALSERLFPRKTVEDPILPDADRRRLSPELVTQDDRVQAQRLALRLAVGAARQQVCLSYPRLDIEQGRPRVPSFYALETLRAAEGYLPGFYELAERAAAAHELRLGWPAPPTPELAIDDAEFDLALLQGIADADPEETTGAAHYLLSANPHLARALRARARRWLRRWTPADGLVDPGSEAIAALARHQMTARSYSATALQHYAACPYRFFLQAIHRLEPREEPEAIELIDPLTRGALFHEVQFDLLSALRAHGLLPLEPQTLSEAQEMVDELLSRRAAVYKDKLAPAIDKVWEDGIAAIRADLREWLRRMALEAEGWCPERFELSFGLADREQADPASRAEPVEIAGELRLRGSIDLVEQHADGRVRVTDHKTGRVWAGANFKIGGGKILQPVLYALAAEPLLGHPIAEGRLYYCTAAGGYESRSVAIDEQARQAAAAVAETIGTALAEGFLPAAPGHGECDRCDYRTVCGPYEELRTSRKPAARLAPLARLRELP